MSTFCLKNREKKSKVAILFSNVFFNRMPKVMVFYVTDCNLRREISAKVVKSGQISSKLHPQSISPKNTSLLISNAEINHKIFGYLRMKLVGYEFSFFSS